MLVFNVFVGTYETTSLVGDADVCVQRTYYAAHQITAVAESQAGGSDNGPIVLAQACETKDLFLKSSNITLKLLTKTNVEMWKEFKRCSHTKKQISFR